MKSKPTPAPGGQMLERELDAAESMNDKFHYRLVIWQGKLLGKIEQAQHCKAVHQCAQPSSDPKQSHADAVILLL
jgi:hypothetical protein